MLKHFFLLTIMAAGSALAQTTYLKGVNNVFTCESWTQSMDVTKIEISNLTNSKCGLVTDTIAKAFHFKCGEGNFLFFHEGSKCEQTLKTIKGEVPSLKLIDFAPETFNKEGYIVSLSGCFGKAINSNKLFGDSIDRTYKDCACMAKVHSRSPDSEILKQIRPSINECFPDSTLATRENLIKQIEGAIRPKSNKVSKKSVNQGLSNEELKAFSASEFDAFPKIEKGISKEDVLSRFGKPKDTSDDGKHFYYENKICKKDSLTKSCSIFFDENGKVYSWRDFKMEYTNNLK